MTETVQEMTETVQEMKDRVIALVRKGVEKTFRPANAEDVKAAVCKRLDEMEENGDLAKLAAELGQTIKRNEDGSWPVTIQDNEVVLHSSFKSPYPLTYIMQDVRSL